MQRITDECAMSGKAAAVRSNVSFSPKTEIAHRGVDDRRVLDGEGLAMSVC
jgi:hypothetical protein